MDIGQITHLPRIGKHSSQVIQVRHNDLIHTLLNITYTCSIVYHCVRVYKAALIVVPVIVLSSGIQFCIQYTPYILYRTFSAPACVKRWKSVGEASGFSAWR